MTTPRRLTLHIGQTKAASTSFQNWMDAHHDSVLAQGVLFPQSVLRRQNASDPERSPGHLGLLRGLASGDLSSFEAELAARPSAHVILSIENLFSDRPDADLGRLGDYFNDWDIRVIAVLRPQLDWLRSRHTENVMSGFKCATHSLPALARQMWERGVLDYRARLAHVAGLLGAAQVHALRFDGMERPLVPRLLEALGLTPGPDAATIHANRRERDPELVEAKRRLNPLIRPLALQPRLRIEHELRRAARDLPPDPEPAEAATGLDPVQIAAMRAGNDALLAGGVLDGSLDTGRPDGSAAPVGGATKRAQVLFDEGLQIAARVAWQDEEAALRAALVPGLTSAQITALCDAIRRNPVSFHLDSPASAELAAAHDGRLAVFLSTDPQPWKMQVALDALETPSPLLALAPPAAGWSDLPAWSQAHGLPSPGLVVIGPACSVDVIAATALLEPGEMFLWPGVEAATFPSLGAWHGKAIGSALLVRRHMPPARSISEYTA